MTFKLFPCIDADTSNPLPTTSASQWMPPKHRAKVVIPELQARGFGLVSVDELFTIKGVEPQKGIIYDRVKK
jgi:hypothetical protein